MKARTRTQSQDSIHTTPPLALTNAEKVTVAPSTIDEFKQALTKLNQNTTLTSLTIDLIHLAQDQVIESICQDLAAWLKTFPWLKQLKIAHGLATTKAVDALVSALQNPACVPNITQLDISQNYSLPFEESVKLTESVGTRRCEVMLSPIIDITELTVSFSSEPEQKRSIHEEVKEEAKILPTDSQSVLTKLQALDKLMQLKEKISAKDQAELNNFIQSYADTITNKMLTFRTHFKPCDKMRELLRDHISSSIGERHLAELNEMKNEIILGRVLIPKQKETYTQLLPSYTAEINQLLKINRHEIAIFDSTTLQKIQAEQQWAERQKLKALAWASKQASKNTPAEMKRPETQPMTVGAHHATQFTRSTSVPKRFPSPTPSALPKPTLGGRKRTQSR